MSASNLWPDFDVQAGPRLPKRVLVEEGKGVKERTKGLIEFEIVSRLREDGDFVHTCFLTVPTLDYRYPFFTASHGGANPYPVAVTTDSAAFHPARNEEEFVELLGSIFRSPSTVNIVRQLLDAAAA